MQRAREKRAHRGAREAGRRGPCPGWFSRRVPLGPTVAARSIGARAGLCYNCARPMELLESHLDTASEEFKTNCAHHRALAEELRRHLEAVKQGGGPELVKRHTSRGKLFV